MLYTGDAPDLIRPSGDVYQYIIVQLTRLVFGYFQAAPYACIGISLQASGVLGRTSAMADK